MTVSKKRQPSPPEAEPEAKEAPAPAPPPIMDDTFGITALCDACGADITHTVHIRCAESAESQLVCPDFDLCVTCFLQGRETGPHKATHAYRVISSHAFPIFTRGWGADEELALVQGIQQFGLGNWVDIAEHVGARTKEECARHYRKVYLESPDFPLPHPSERVAELSVEEFQQRKRRRLEEVQRRPVQLPPPKPTASGPACHEIASFMPGRLEFDTEYENDAEVLIKDLEFGRVYKYGGEKQPDDSGHIGPPPVTEESDEEADSVPGMEIETPEGLKLKLAILDIFNSRYDKRMENKRLIFDRGLTHYKWLTANERKRPKEERDLIMRSKVFHRIQTGPDAQDFVSGLLYEMNLRRRIGQLQEYRRNGLTSLAEGRKYEQDRAARLSGQNHHSAHGYSADVRKAKQRALASNSVIAQSTSYSLLSPLEQQLCHVLRVLPKPYLLIKETLLQEWVRRQGRMTPEHARLALNAHDPRTEYAEKIERIWEALVILADLKLASSEPIDDKLRATEEQKPVLTNGAGSTNTLTNGHVNGFSNGHSTHPDAMDVD